MRNEKGDNLKSLLEERARAATVIEARLAEMKVRIGEMLNVQYSNGTSRTDAYNGWLITEAGAKYLRLGTGSVPPVYITHIDRGASKNK